MIEELFQALVESGADAGPEELAEILWLAARIDGTGIRTPGHPSDAHHDGSTPPPHEQESPPTADTSDPRRAELFYSAADITDTPSSAARNVDLVRIRRAASLRDPLAVMRALRPLARHTGLPGDADRGELDEELTVRSTIEQCLPFPVLRPRRVRWLDLALVVDTHHSMLLWHDLVKELRRTFTQTGIFRDVRAWYLSGTGPGEAPSVARAGGEPRSVQEVADPSGHRLILVVTDTVAGGWSTSKVQDMLRHWSSHNPVALLNVLPRRLWDRGAVRPQPHLIRAPKPAAPNASWRLGHAAGSRRRERHRAALARSIAVPVVEASVGSISALAELVADDGRWSRLPCLTVARQSEELSKRRPVEPLPPLEPPVDEVLRRFRAGASPLAQTLAGYLSAVPLNLPVMNLVRQIMLPKSEHGHLAEVALGGLFESWEHEAREGRTDMERMPFRFRAGVREALLGSQRRHEITAVQELVRREIGAFVTEHNSGSAGDFLAARDAAGEDGSRTTSPAALPFAAALPTGAPSPVGRPVREVLAPHEEHLLRHIRDLNARLHAAMRRAVNGHSALVLLVGESGSGKIAAAARAIHEMPDDWKQWSPDVSLTLAQGAPQVGPRTVVTLRDLQTYTTASGFPVEEMARVVRDLIEDTERVPVMVLGTLTPAAWDNLVAMAQQGPPGDYENCRHLIAHAEVIRVNPADVAPEQWPGEPSHTRLVVIANTSDRVRAGSAFHHLGTGFLLGPRLILTAAHILNRLSQTETVMKVRNRRGTVTADGWVDCRVLWTHGTHDAALLLAGEDLSEPATDSHFSVPRWAQLTSDEPLSPCHLTGVLIADAASPQPSRHLTGTLHSASPHPDAAYEFEPTNPLPQLRSTKPFARGMSGAPVFFGDFLLGFAIAMRDDRSARPRFAVAAISTLVNDRGFTDACSQYMRRIPRLDPLPDALSTSAGDDHASGGLTGRRPPRVFISYAREDDDGTHAEQVRSLWRLLRTEGIDARLDQIDIEAGQNLTAWIRHEIQAADFVLVIVSPSYRRADDRKATPSTAVALEARLLRNELAHSPTDTSQRILAVALPGHTLKHLPAFLRPFAPYIVEPITPTGAAPLLQRLAQRPPPAADHTDPAEQARHSTDLAEHHWRTGHHTEALATADQAIEVYRRLAADNPAYRPDLATALITQSDRLAETGRSSEALQAAREAVDIAEGTARSDPDAFRPSLAMDLSTLSNRLAETGQRKQALAAAERAVVIRRQLADTDPVTHTYDLARSLSNLSNRLTDLGRHREALSAITEAVTVTRQFAEINPETFLPGLATMLNNQGTALRETGRPTEAVHATEEAVLICRKLARTGHDAAVPGLASTLLNLGVALSETGRREEALSTAEEAVTLCRHLTEPGTDAHSHRLAAALHNLSLRLSEAGRSDEALTALDEAIALRRRLVATNPDAFLPDLAQSLNAAAGLRTSWRQDLGRALEEAGEAVEIFRRFAAQFPAVFISNLHQAMATQAAVLNGLGRSDEADQIRRSLVPPDSGEATDVQIRTEHENLEELQSLLRWLQEQPGFRGQARIVTRRVPTGLVSAIGMAVLHVGGPGAALLATALTTWLATRRPAHTTLEVTMPDGRQVTVSAERPDEARAALESLLGQEE